MMFSHLKRSPMLTPTKGERLTRHPVVVLLLFLAVMLVAQWGRSRLYTAGVLLIPGINTPTERMLLQVFVTVWTVICVLFFCLLVERRSLASLGFSPRGGFLEYGVGLAGGLVLFGAAVLLAVLTGTVTLSPVKDGTSLLLLPLFFVGFLIQGMSEELLCRSYLMISLSRKWPVWIGVVGNALLFSLLHLGNPNVSPIALINIFLFGLFASVLTLRRGSIWMAGAIHSMWNFAQGNLFGIPVSGLTGLPSPLAATIKEGTWQTLISGGKFGLEGGLAVTVILLAACGLVLFLPKLSRKGEH